jgi:hypothetical protein
MKKIIVLIILGLALAGGTAVTTFHSDLAEACQGQEC